jgi:hypothetical protein
MGTDQLASFSSALCDASSFVAPALVKIAAPKPPKKFVEKAVDWATTPKLQDMGAEGVTGLNRLKQLLGAHRAKALFKQYEDATDPAERERLLRELVKEDTRVTGTRAATVLGTGAGIGLAGQGLAKGIASLGRRGAEALAASGATEEEKKQSPREALRASLSRRGVGSTGQNIAERWLLKGEDTDKVTAEEALGIPLNAAVAGVTGAAVARPVLERLVGAQTFYHGTDPESAKAILRTGLDPIYGGREGGVAHTMEGRAQEARDLRARAHAFEQEFNRVVADHEAASKAYYATPRRDPAFDEVKLKFDAAEAAENDVWRRRQKMIHERETPYDLRRRADEIVPRQPLMSVSKGGFEGVPMEHAKFLENAKGRSFVGKGDAGRGAAAAYAVLQDPTEFNRINAEVMEAGKLMNNGQKLKGVIKGDIAALKGAYRLLNPSGDSPIVGGVMPYEEFHQRFEPDPDDITRFQTGHRSQRPDMNSVYAAAHPERAAAGVAEAIDPSQLAKNKPSLGQILKNRSKNWVQYASKNKKRVGAGVALAALPVALGGYQAATAGNRVVQKLRGKYEPPSPTE